MKEILAELDARTVYTDNLGFVADPTPVQAEYVAVSEIAGRYLDGKMLYTGHQTPAEVDAMAAEFVEALNAAGVDRLREEYQRQLDAWRAGR